MSRELKFRAWDKKRKRMYNVLHLHTDGFNMNWCTVFGLDIIEQKDIHLQIQPENAVIMQYSGIRDKKGDQIYEGDIVRITVDICMGTPWEETFSLDGYHQGEVIIHRRYGVCIKDYFTIDNADGEVRSKGKFKTIPTYRSEIIGNIYENPELLTVKK